MSNLKKVTTVAEQIQILKSRNLIINDEMRATQILTQISYYRLSGYYRNFYHRASATPLFQDGATLEQIYQLSCFDRELKSILFNMIQAIEVSFRNFLSIEITQKYGIEGWNRVDLFIDRNESSNKKISQMANNYVQFQNTAKRELHRSREEFILHHENKYDSKFPTWVILEILSFGTLSKLYKNMKSENKKAIAKEYYLGAHYTFIESWMEKFVILRNICAHHGRLVNRSLVCGKLTPTINQHQAKGLFAYLLFIKEHIDMEEEYNNLISDLTILFKKYPSIDPSVINFPSDWFESLKI